MVSLLALVGTPPTGVFTGKLTVFAATWDGGWAWLVVVAAVNTVASLYYYLRWIAPAFARPGPPAAPAAETTGSRSEPSAQRWDARCVVATAVTAGCLALLIGIAADSVLAIGSTGITW